MSEPLKSERLLRAERMLARSQAFERKARRLERLTLALVLAAAFVMALSAARFVGVIE